MESGDGDAEIDEAVMRALEATDHEQALLAAVSDLVLRDKLLFLLLRAEVGAKVDVHVCPSMHMSDQFSQFNIEEAVKQPYLAAQLERKRERPPLFGLHCADAPENDRTYDGEDDVQDKLIEFFSKDLIRFDDKVRWTASSPALTHATHSSLRLRVCHR